MHPRKGLRAATGYMHHLSSYHGGQQCNSRTAVRDTLQPTNLAIQPRALPWQSILFNHIFFVAYLSAFFNLMGWDIVVFSG